MNSIRIPELEAEGIKMFEPKELPAHPSIGLCSVRRAGKTVIVQHVLSDLKDRFDEIFFFSTTALLLHEDYQFIPKENKYDHVDLDKISEVIAEQERIIQYNQTVPKSDKIINRVCLLFDDCISDNNSRSKIVDGIYTKGRHIHCSVIFLSQMYKNTESGGFKKTARLNCDVIMSFVQANEDDRKAFVSENLSIINKKEGMKIFNMITNHEYCAIVINLHKIAKARSYKDYVQYLKVDADKNPRKFMIGDKMKQISRKKPERKIENRSSEGFSGYGTMLKRKKK